MEKILQTFLKSTYSTGQAKRRLIALRVYLEQKFFQSQHQDLGPDTAWLRSQDEDFYKNFNQLNVYKILDNLETEINKLDRLTIFISFDMPEEELNKLGAWTRQNMTSVFLLETKLDPALIGGAGITFKGIYKDYSLRERIEKNKDRILTGFKEYYGKFN